MAVAKKSHKAVTDTRRAIAQSASQAIRDVYDIIVELVTNADDRYTILEKSGRIEIEIIRKRKSPPGIVRVRDFADGMDAKTMDTKLSTRGGRESGLAEGKNVRGTHSRGAKDIAALGKVQFESIAQDGSYHLCSISPQFFFTGPESFPVTKDIRQKLRIPSATGTVVTIELDSQHSIPLFKKLKADIPHLVALRDIMRDQSRELVLTDVNKGDSCVLKAPNYDGNERLKETLQVSGYPDARAKLVVCRAHKKFDADAKNRFRLGGILVKSRRGIHESTLFEPALERDPHAQVFYGKLTCEYIDDLCNDFDERFEAGRKLAPSNPNYILDPSRRSGLLREHPFVKELFKQARSRIRPLVEEERRRAEGERAKIESSATRKRLNKLEKIAMKFMKEFGHEDDRATHTDHQTTDSNILQSGFLLSPPYTKLIVGHKRNYTFEVHLGTHPGFEVGETVQVEPLTDNVSVIGPLAILEKHPVKDGILRAHWQVEALSKTAATGIKVRAGEISAEAMLEVLGSAAEEYESITSLCFHHKRYRARIGQKRKRVRILAPIEMVPEEAKINVVVESRDFAIVGETWMRPHLELGVSICECGVKVKSKEECTSKIVASIAGHKAEALVSAIMPLGAGLKIILEDVDLENQRYRWRNNVLEIAARHPSLRRYLGPKDDKFPGQENRHFRVLVAEIVADAVCGLLLRRQEENNPEDYENADWDTYYADYTKLMTEFLPDAHKVQLAKP